MNRKTVFLFLNTFLLILTIVGINFYLFAGNEFLFILLLSFIFLFLFLFIIYKQKNIYTFIIPFFIVILYSFFYTYISFISVEDNLFINEEKKYEANQISFERHLGECLDSINCDISSVFLEEKQKINSIINESNSILNIFILESYLTNLLNSKNKLIDLGIWNNFSISFNKDNYTKNILNGEYNNQLKNINSINNNLFFTKTSYSKFLKIYYLDIYKGIIENNFENIEKKYQKTPLIYYILNREYFYNNLVFSHTNTLVNFSQKLNKIEKLIHEINK